LFCISLKFCGSITPSGVITAGNYGAFPVVAPATWMEIYGVNLATTVSQTWAGTDFTGNQAPTALGGTTVTVGGKSAFVDFVSPGQVNVQVPSDVAAGTQPVPQPAERASPTVSR